MIILRVLDGLTVLMAVVGLVSVGGYLLLPDTVEESEKKAISVIPWFCAVIAVLLFTARIVFRPQ